MPNDSSTGGFLAPSGGFLVAEDNALDALLQALVVGVTAIPGNLVRPRWQPVPPPQPEAGTDWCAIGVTDEDPEPNVSTVHTATGNGFSTTYENDIVTVLASFYGPTARGNANLLRSGMMVGQNRETLLVNTNLALMAIPGKSTFVPEIVNNVTVRRVDIEMRFRRRTILVWPIENLLAAKGTIATDDGAQQPFYTGSSGSFGDGFSDGFSSGF
jgi:hypothetical protein